MEFLQRDCPADVLPKVLAFCGPKQTAALSKVNKHWRSIVLKEGTWRVLCEELYKWKPGDKEPKSWMEHYKSHPCVPVDYSSIHSALSPRKKKSSITVLLRPGKYFLKQAIDIEDDDDDVAIQTIKMPQVYRAPISQIMEQPLPVEQPRKRSSSFRNMLTCNRDRRQDETETEEMDFEDFLDSRLYRPPKHATLVLRSRKQNEPVFRVTAGTLNLADVEIQHNSHGLDIWNGNAAIQIQPPEQEETASPTAILNRVIISSRTGRGIVNIDGGKLHITSSAIHDCAATGIYIGGPGSSAIIRNSDVLRNGVGNRMRRGIARGHSGIYLEQGEATIESSNISSNTLTGISVVSPDNASLTIQNSKLLSNGTYQLELPAVGTASRGRCVITDTELSVRGETSLASGLQIN